MKRKVSIITVNFNQSQVTMELLRSIEQLGLNNLEVIVVDNGSKSDNQTIIKTNFPWITFIQSEQNLGFAGGNNLGIAASTGDYLFFLNNDTELTEGTIDDLVKTLEEHPEAGAVNPLIYYYDQPTLVQFAGYTPINKITGRNEAIGYHQTISLSQEIFETPYAHGAAMLVRREVIEQIGGMPENYFLYYEELDWGRQIAQAGYKILVSHRSAIYHKESISTGKSSPLKTYFQTRNRILFMRRNYHGLGLMLFLIFFGFLALPKSILKFTIHHEWKHLKSFLAGVRWHFQNGIHSQRIGYIYEELRS